MKSFERILKLLNSLLLIVAGAAIVALMVVAAGNVFLRMAGRPFSGTYEIVGFLGAVLTAFALGATQRRKDHVVVDILTMHFPAWLNRGLDVLHSLATLAFFAAVSWFVVEHGLTLRRTGEVSETLKFIYYPFVFAVAFGFCVLALNLLYDIVRLLFCPEETR